MRALTGHIDSSTEDNGQTDPALSAAPVSWSRRYLSVDRTAKVEESVRRQLARELHDQAGWHLSALNYGLFAAETNPGNSEALRELRSRLDALSAVLREITTEFRRPRISFNLIASLANLGEEWTRMVGIPVLLHTEPGDFQLPMLITETVVAVTREALTNVAKHADAATSVNITIASGAKDAIIIRILDDGPGIDTDAIGAGSGNHHGILGMRERLARIGSNLCIGRGATGGTLLSFEINRTRAR